MELYIPAYILSQGFLSGLIGTISQITISSCNLITSIYSHQNPDVVRFLRRLDVDHKIKIIGAMLKHFDHSSDIEFVIISKNQHPIELALESLSQSLELIQKYLTILNDKLLRYNNKYFKQWRTLNIKEVMDDLELEMSILDQRYDMFIKISSLYFNAQKGGHPKYD